MSEPPSTDESEPVPSPERRRKRRRWRPVLRGLHRDAGYLAVGLTVVYALSGIAVNHIDDWDPNFSTSQTEHRFEIPDDTVDAVATVTAELGIEASPRSIYRAAPDRLDVVVDERLMLTIDPIDDRVVVNERESRFVLRAANWLHLNRGKAAWTYIADAYAVLLLFLALSGLVMVRGRYGVAGRGWVLVAIGIAVPVLYVTLSGGPSGQRAVSSSSGGVESP